MINQNFIFYITLLLTLCYSCVEPYEVRSVNFARAVVVDGRITNEGGTSYVKLSFTRPIDVKTNVSLTGATVWVEGSDGTKIDFMEVEPGFYRPVDGEVGEVGKSYQLFFTTAEGRRYQSTPQELIAAPPIDRIYHRYAERTSKNSGEMNKGIQFFLDSRDDAGGARNFRYEWEDTYEVQSPFPSLYSFSSNPDTVISREAMGEVVHICYASGKSSSILLGSTANLTDSRISEMPIRYITTETDQLRYAYSLLVRQYAISAGAYRFYREMLENNQDNESLFEKQMGVIVGNITLVEDPEETVLGYFEVAGVTEKRIFVKYEDLDRRYPWPNQSNPCDPNEMVNIIDLEQPLPYKLIDSVRFYINKGFTIFTAMYCDSLSAIPPPPSPLPVVPPCTTFYFKAQLLPKICGDCRFRGSTTKPDFWIY